ncbi:MAG TPA: SprT family zinc-dependent metalloprotease [Candidatus Saccharimonadales bacterium]|nr:SprT family zinc-dependent metalloprotease [Candidatus Saccharimonadales bacterium]
MANKRFILDGDLPVSIYKRRNSRSLRLTVSSEGEVKVSIPAWAPYSAGVNFAKSRRSWIASQRRPVRDLSHGQQIGKAYHIYFRPQASAIKPASRLGEGAVIVSHPPDMDAAHPDVQKAARDGSVRALRAQAERLLPQRLATLADSHGFTYSGVRIKRLRSRWGSCDQDGMIALSLFLIQLPWECIDYVLLHELMHTRIMRHGPDFWEALLELEPRAKDLRKRLRSCQPSLDSPAVADVA